MQRIDLLSNCSGEETLDGFAKKFFDAIGISAFEERESSNYPDNRYFKGCNKDLTYEVMRSDDETHGDLPYWIHVISGSGDAAMLVSKVNQLVNARLLPAGFHVARVANFGRKDMQRIDY